MPRVDRTALLLYIHGFNSSPESQKARQLAALMQRLGLAGRLRVPALHHHPREAIAQLEAALAELGRPVLVGSSLGGYYATLLAERHGLRAVLINPRWPRTGCSTANWDCRRTTTAARPGS